MVCQMPCPDRAHVFVASSVENEEQGRREVQSWANGNGYQVAASSHTFTTFRGGCRPREWTLLERGAAKS